MADIMSPEKRRALMSRIRGCNTGIERVVFRALRAEGVRFATHAKELPGKPDVAFRSLKMAVFIDSDFWHGWRFPAWSSKLQPYWKDKIATNRNRDRRNIRRLRRMGWTVVRAWEHQLDADLPGVIARILRLRNEKLRLLCPRTSGRSARH